MLERRVDKHQYFVLNTCTYWQPMQTRPYINSRSNINNYYNNSDNSNTILHDHDVK